MERGYLLLAAFSSVKRTVSPCLTRTTGPGTCPVNVQALYRSPELSMTASHSMDHIRTSWVAGPAGVIAPPSMTAPRMKARRVAPPAAVRGCLIGGSL